MEVIDPQQFLLWARTHGIAPDLRYSEPRCLVYMPDRPHHRFWEVPQRAAQVPFFIAALLDGMDPWSYCCLWPRDGWPHAGTPHGPQDQVYEIILSGSGIPTSTDGAVRFSADEKDKLVAAVFAALTFGWSVQDDFFVIPDHGRQFLQTDHHSVVHVNFAEEQTIDTFVKHMAVKKFALPDEAPDETFKRPEWMK
jgi:hypothetical protein